MSKRLAQSFYARPATVVAQALLGQILVRELDGVRLAGRIVETEAYCDGAEPDLACHGSKNGGRPTARSPRRRSRRRAGRAAASRRRCRGARS